MTPWFSRVVAERVSMTASIWTLSLATLGLITSWMTNSTSLEAAMALKPDIAKITYVLSSRYWQVRVPDVGTRVAVETGMHLFVK